MSRSAQELRAAQNGILMAMAPHFCPGNEQLNFDHDQFVNIFNRFLREFPKLYYWGFILGLILFEWLPCASFARLSRFTQLSQSAQLKYLQSWELSRLYAKREFFKAVRGMIQLCYGFDHEFWKYIGYDPEPHIKERIALRQKLLIEQKQ